MNMTNLDVIVEASNSLLHGPSPDSGLIIHGPCVYCKKLSSEEKKLFQEVKGILVKIFASSAEGDSGKEENLLERLSEKVSGKTNLAKLCDSSAEGGCETLLHL